MEMMPVKSSNIAAAGWDASTSTLVIQFKEGKQYAYTGVPESLYRAFLAAPSKGAFFAKRIRDHFPTRPA